MPAAPGGLIVPAAIAADDATIFTLGTFATPEVEDIAGEELTPLYNVILLDDDEHTYDYVIEMLQKLFLFSRTKAFQHAVEVDSTGRTLLITCELPQAEYARDQIHGYGADWRMPESKGSMSAVIEPAASGPKTA